MNPLLPVLEHALDLIEPNAEDDPWYAVFLIEAYIAIAKLQDCHPLEIAQSRKHQSMPSALLSDNTVNEWAWAEKTADSLKLMSVTTTPKVRILAIPEGDCFSIEVENSRDEIYSTYPVSYIEDSRAEAIAHIIRLAFEYRGFEILDPATDWDEDLEL